MNSKNPFVGSERGLTQIDSRTHATAQVSEETGNGDDKNHCIEFVRSKLGTTFPDDAMDRAAHWKGYWLGRQAGTQVGADQVSDPSHGSLRELGHKHRPLSHGRQVQGLCDCEFAVRRFRRLFVENSLSRHQNLRY